MSVAVWQLAHTAEVSTTPWLLLQPQTGMHQFAAEAKARERAVETSAICASCQQTSNSGARAVT